MRAAVWLHEQKFELGPQACTGAARAGNLELLQWLHSCGAHWEADTIAVAAAAGGSVAVLQFLNTDTALGQHWDSTALTRLLRVAGRHGQLAAAQWLYSLGGALPERMWDVDVCWLHSGTLQWAVEQGVESQQYSTSDQQPATCSLVNALIYRDNKTAFQTFLFRVSWVWRYCTSSQRPTVGVYGGVMYAAHGGLDTCERLKRKFSCVVARHSTAVHRNTVKCTLVRYWYSYYYLDEYCYCHC
eukprot:16902-Heterococcus_DN1.PRE.1